MKATRNEVEVRAYSRPSKMRKKYLGLPLFAWAILLGAGVVSAAVLGPTLSRTQSVTSVTLAEQSGANAVDAIVAYGVVDTVILDASNTGSSPVAGFFVHVTVSISCASFSANIADSTGALGKVEFKPLAGAYAAITVPTTGASPCAFDTTPTFSLPAGPSTAAASFKWMWNGPSPPASVTWTFTPSA